MIFRIAIFCLLSVQLVFGSCGGGNPSKDACLEAAEKCDFMFKWYVDPVPEFWLWGPDRVFTTKIISKKPNEYLGVLNGNIEPEFIADNGDVSPISNFGMTPTQFKPFSHKYWVSGNTYEWGSGIGHETFQNGSGEAKGKCVRVYFKEYQLLHYSGGNVKTNKNNVPKSANKCVVFRTRD